MTAHGATEPLATLPAPVGGRHLLAKLKAGCAEPFHVLRALLRVPAARRYYLRVTLVQLGVVLGCAVVVALLRFDDAPKRPHAKAPRAPKVAAHETGLPPLPPLPSAPAAPAAPALPSSLRVLAGDGGAIPSLPDVDRIVAEAQAAAVAAQKAAPRAGTVAEDRDDDDDDDEADDDGEAAPLADSASPAAPGSPTTLAARLTVYRRKLALFFAELYAALLIVQGIVLALSRDFHDVITRTACVTVGAPPENAPAVPRVRVNFPWMKKKLRRRLRGLVLFAIGLPILGALAVLTALPFVTLDGPVPTWVRHGTYVALTAVWGAYWVAVFAGASTELAWRDERARYPWFARAARGLVEHVPGFRWFAPRLYAATLERVSRSIVSPAAAFERRPVELLGLALARTVVSIPGVYLFFRPVFPVAAARIHLGAVTPAARIAPASAAPALPATPP